MSITTALPDIAFVALDNETFPLFRNLGRRGFADITGTSGLARLTLPMAGYSPTIADFDNDGWKDIFATRGHVQALGAKPRCRSISPTRCSAIWAARRFQALTEEAGLTAQPPARHRGSAVGDLNGDGRLDVVTTALSAPAEVWLNDSPGQAHWLELKLEGTISNRDGIGARIKVTAGGARSTTTFLSPPDMPPRALRPSISGSARRNRPPWSRFAGHPGSSGTEKRCCGSRDSRHGAAPQNRSKIVRNTSDARFQNSLKFDFASNHPKAASSSMVEQERATTSWGSSSVGPTDSQHVFFG